MLKAIFIGFLALIVLLHFQSTPVTAEVTHEDIRGILQSLVYSYNQLDNKLERHEHRERALGELLKKAMQSLQKGQKNLEPIHGTFARLDERVSQIESMLLSHEEKYTTQVEKVDATLEDIFKWMLENNECLKRPPLPPPMAAVAPTTTTPSPPSLPQSNPLYEEFIAQQKQINSDVMQQLKLMSTNIEQLLQVSKDLMATNAQALKQEPTTIEMLSKIEDKLISYSVAAATPPPPVIIEPIDNSAFENKVFEKFNELSSSVSELQAAPKVEPGLSADDKDFLHGLTNDTLSALQQLKTNVVTATEDATTVLKGSEQRIVDDVKQVLNGVTNTSDVLGQFYGQVNGSYTKLKEALEIFSKFNDILMTNSETVLSTQRKVQFGTIQVVQKIEAQLDKQREEIAALLKERFDSVDESIVSSQLKAVQNLSSVIESEISQVWRQMSIMHGEINLLSGRDDAFVNNTFNSVTMMSTKVEEIQENLNFLIGKLSVVAQEFKNIKIGLAESLQDLRHTFQSVQKELPGSTESQNPGPHTIPNNQYETEVNLLKKRHTNI